MNKKINLTYDDVHECCKIMLRKHQGVKFDAVMAVVRGGLIPGVIISHALNIPLVTMDIKCINSAGDNINQHIDYLPELNNYSSILIVEDIVDSGAVLSKAIKLVNYHYPDIDFAAQAIHYKDTEHNREHIMNNNHLLFFSSAITIPEKSPFINYPWELK
jgi:hypoxanthine phosphoribosyltransferase